jgi:hypothetical protein
MIPKPGAGLNVVLVDSRGFIQVLRLDNDDQSVITAQQGVDGWIGRPGESHEISCADIGEDGVITALGAFP